MCRSGNVRHAFGSLCSFVSTNLGLRPTVITTNYDLVAEKHLEAAKLRWRYPSFLGTAKDGLVCATPCDASEVLRAEAPEVSVIKLHGSANWFTGGSHRWCCVEDLDGWQKLQLETVQKKLGATCGDGVQPGIIPPMLGKRSDDSIFAKQWRAAIYALHVARMVVVVGYSFPRTDAFMSRLLTEGLMHNQDFRFLGVVDTTQPERHGIQELLAPRLRDRRFVYCQSPAETFFQQMLGYPSADAWPKAFRDLSA